MATAPQLDPITEAMIDDLMASGRFAARADVLRFGVKLAHDQENGADEPLDAETIAMLEARIAEADANPDDWLSVDEVFDAFERRNRAGE